MFEQIHLERIRLAVLHRLTDNGYNIDVRADTVDDLAEKLALKIEAAILAHTFEEDVASYPADWVSAFKLRFFPEWALKRWPPEMVTLKYTRYEHYPRMDVTLPNHVNSITFMVVRGNKTK